MVALLAIAAAAAGPVRGQNSSTVTFSCSDFPATTNAAFQQTKGDITVAVSTGTVTDLVRVFADNTFTVSTSSGNLSSVAITCAASGTSKYGPGGFGSPTAGSYSYEGTVGTWTAPSGGATSFTLTASAQVRITSIEVTYTPASGGSGSQTPAGENIFQYCYDCQRNPPYPKAASSASLSGFSNPYVGYNGSNNTSAGPWKLEYMGIWSSTEKYGINSVYSYQQTYNCTDVPVFRLYQWNPTANEYQHAAYGVVCCYAKVSNAVEHTALFVAEGGWGCVLTNSSHSSAMSITFDEDLSTGLATLTTAPAPTPAGPITCTLEDVGKVLCSDGSIYATASAASADSKTAVAMITYLDVTTHKGLAMSLTDVNTGSFCFQTDETCLANQYGAADVALGDMDGLANTTALVAHATHEHGAAHVAANYNVARPEGASAWFLPSAGQWDRMVTAAGGYESLQSMLSLASDLYWSSSERNRFNAWAISFNSQELGNYTKTETHRVRACFEFDANILVPHTVRFAAGNDGWMVTDVDSARSATAPAILNGVMAGDSLVVTAPATLPGKVKSVKAVKYVPPVVLQIASPAVGQVIGSDGKNYAYASLPSGVTAVALICYVNGNNGLALAMSDEEGKMSWSDAVSTCEAHTAPFIDGTWKLATVEEWNWMVQAVGSIVALRDGFSAVGGTNMLSDDFYWSGTAGASTAQRRKFSTSGLGWGGTAKTEPTYARACLAF